MEKAWEMITYTIANLSKWMVLLCGVIIILAELVCCGTLVGYLSDTSQVGIDRQTTLKRENMKLWEETNRPIWSAEKVASHSECDCLSFITGQNGVGISWLYIRCDRRWSCRNVPAVHTQVLPRTCTYYSVIAGGFLLDAAKCMGCHISSRFTVWCIAHFYRQAD